jgi:phosphoserine phosphatase
MGLDVNAVPLAGRRKRMLLADMDSTMIRQECIDELAAEAGVGARVAEITARAMNGEIGFEGALLERVGLLRGLPAEVTERVWRERIELMPGARALVATMRAAGARCVLVSGGFTTFTARVAAAVGFHEHRANELLSEDGVLTGEVGRPILGREAKVAALEEAVARLGIGEADVLAVGDGANDLGMLRRAGLGVALHAKPAVQREARHRVNHGDLTALLHLQGYAAEEFAGG